MNDKLEIKNPDEMTGDLVIFKNPAIWHFVDSTPSGKIFRLRPGDSVIIPKTLAIWFIGDYDSPFWKQGPGSAEEIKAIYSRNRYHEIFCRVIGPAPEESEVGKDEDEKPYEEVEAPKEKLTELAEKPKVILVTTDHLNRTGPVDPDRAGGPDFM